MLSALNEKQNVQYSFRSVMTLIGKGKFSVLMGVLEIFALSCFCTSFEVICKQKFSIYVKAFLTSVSCNLISQKSVKRRHSGESASPSGSPTETKVRDVGPNKEDVGSDEVQMTPSIYSNDNAHFQEDEDPDDVDRRALLKDPFWNDLENGVIVPNLFETDMYSKVKSRRATLEAKRKQKEEETDDQRSSSLNESQSSEKSSPGGASKKNQSLSQDAGETKRHKKKKYSNKHDPGKKKKKKKDHKSKKKHRQVKMDLEAIGSLESATQKSLKMSPSDLDGSDNSANLFISRIPAEEVLTVAKLEEQSRQSSSNGSQSSDGSEECDQAAKVRRTQGLVFVCLGRCTTKIFPESSFANGCALTADRFDVSN